jgi:hypothetical protein
MSYAEKTFYVAVCDGCGIEHEDEEFAAWSDQGGARCRAEDSEWRMQDDGRFLCESCRFKPGGDLHEDEE